MKSKKKILFFLPSFAGGGAEKVTITFINNIPLEEYEVHLAVLNGKGKLKKLLNKNIIYHNLNTIRLRYSIFKMVNSNIEEFDLLNNSLVMFEPLDKNYSLEKNINGKGLSSIFTAGGGQHGIKIDSYRNKILVNLKNNYMNLSDLNKIVIKAKDDIMQKRILSCSFLDEDKKLVSKINLEVFNNKISEDIFKNFVYYNVNHYGNNSLPKEYSSKDSNITYFKTFSYEFED